MGGGGCASKTGTRGDTFARNSREKRDRRPRLERGLDGNDKSSLPMPFPLGSHCCEDCHRRSLGHVLGRPAPLTLSRGQVGPAPRMSPHTRGGRLSPPSPRSLDGRCVLSRRPRRRRRRRPGRACRHLQQIEQSGWRGLRQVRPWSDYGIVQRFQWGWSGRELRGR
jgi:hypothetical protein